MTGKRTVLIIRIISRLTRRYRNVMTRNISKINMIHWIMRVTHKRRWKLKNTFVRKKKKKKRQWKLVKRFAAAAALNAVYSEKRFLNRSIRNTRNTFYTCVIFWIFVHFEHRASVALLFKRVTRPRVRKTLIKFELLSFYRKEKYYFTETPWTIFVLYGVI